jgi:2-amino-4-hydroxy-6-hydroxymethyldihydropteridine diphosphokinase
VSAHRAYVGIGSNLGDRVANVDRAAAKLAELGEVARRSSYYRTKPWGNTDQPWYLNAVALVETGLPPQELLDRLHAIEEALGRKRGERWAPRVIDLDLLLYDDLQIATSELCIPHPRLGERAFVLVPLSEIDDRFAPLRDALTESDLAGVVRVERETIAAMSQEEATSASERVRALARFLAEGEATRVRIRRGNEEIELSAAPRVRATAPPAQRAGGERTTQRVDAIRADLVGMFHLSRPAPMEGEVFEGDRELGYIEALGIRTPIHSMGAGRLVSVATPDGAPVEYGQPLFLVARGS